MKKNIIYSDDLIEYIEHNKSDIIQNLSENDTTPNDDEIMKEAQSDINCDYEQLKYALNYYDKKNNNKILVVGLLGLWYGEREGIKEYNSLRDAVLSLFQDINTIYFEKKNTTLTLKAIHHDGTNIFKFYKLINGKKYAITWNDMQEGF